MTLDVFTNGKLKINLAHNYFSGINAWKNDFYRLKPV